MREYAVEVAGLVVFCLRLSVIKLAFSSAALPKPTRETWKKKYAFDDRAMKVLDSLRNENKPSLLSRSKIESNYGKLMLLLPDDVVWSSWSYILRGRSFKQLYDSNIVDDEQVCAAFWNSLKSMHSLFCSVLLQTVQEPASTNKKKRGTKKGETKKGKQEKKGKQKKGKQGETNYTFWGVYN